MSQQPHDRIHIRDLLLRCVVGVYEWEQQRRQDVLFNITMHTDVRAAAASDDIADTVDYKALKTRIVALAEEGRFALLERLASEVATVCLEDSRVARVDVSVDKPGALRYARSVAVELTRTREGVAKGA